jgi:hypothetical protein
MDLASYVKACEGRIRRKAFWVVRMGAPHRVLARRLWLTGESRTAGNGSGDELTSRIGAAERCS